MTAGITDYAGTATHHATIGLPDSTRPAGVDDFNAALEDLKDETLYIEANIGERKISNVAHGKNLGTSIAGQSTSNTFGTGDLELVGGTTTVGDLEIVKVSCSFHAAGSGATQAEYRLAYKIGPGGTLHEIQRAFDGSIGTDVRDKTISGSFMPADDAESGGALYLYLQVRSPGGVNTSYIYEPWAYFAEGTEVTT